MRTTNASPHSRDDHSALSSSPSKQDHALVDIDVLVLMVMTVLLALVMLLLLLHHLLVKLVSVSLGDVLQGLVERSAWLRSDWRKDRVCFCRNVPSGVIGEERDRLFVDVRVEEDLSRWRAQKRRGQ